MAVAPEIIIKDKWVPDALSAKIRRWSPQSQLGLIVRECLGYLPVELAADLLDRITSAVVIESQLAVVVFRHPESPFRVNRSGIEDYGIVSRKVVTTAGVGFLVDAFQNSVELENMKYHGIGTGSTAEATGDTALVTELTTQYQTDSTRATGTTTEGASANIYRTVGTNTVDASVTIQEHGIFSDATVASGVLLDRSLTGGQALSSGDSLQSTYDLTCSAGG